MSAPANLLSRLAGILKGKKDAPSRSAPAASDWARIGEIFTATLQRPPQERSAFLAANCCGDPTLRREVESLLGAHGSAGPLDRLADAMQGATTQPRPALGTKVGHYQLEQQLGAGGMGIVYRAHDLRLQRTVALKFLPWHLSSDESAKERLLREAQAAASLDHPNICTIHEIGEAGDGRLFIAMSFYSGEPLDGRLSRGPLSLTDALDIAVQAARGLQKAHERGIVHRDVKPANLMLTQEGVVKILDFGIAKMASMTTQGGLVLGTLHYMSPEQASGGEVDIRSDLWSLGVVLYEMIEGKRPITAEQPEAVVSSIIGSSIDVTPSKAASAPAVSRILRRLLEKAPQDRYPSATALIPDLEDALQQTRAGRTPQPAVEAAEEFTAINPEGERRQATLLVVRLAGYSSLVERTAPADLQRAMASTRKVVDEVVGTRGGIVNRFGVDQFTCIFGVPVTHEDDCVSATRAALELQSRLWPTLQGLIPSLPKLGLQIGIASGLCIVQPARRGDSLYTLAGQPVEMASMLASHAAPGETLLPLECRRLVLPFFAVSGGQPLHLPDRPEPMSSLRILGESGVATRLEGATRAGLTDFTGREHELSAMLAHLGQALRGEGQLVTVVGDAGLGKSRLLHEFTRLLQGREVRLIRGRCSSRQGASPYFPFIEALQELLRVGTGQGSDLDPEMIASRIASISTKLSQFVPLYLHVLGIPSERHPPPRHLQGDRLRSAICEALSAIFTLAAGEQGAAVLLEDWHWADAASREGLRQLADIVPSHRLLLLITYRSGYGVVWGESTVHRTIQLGPLDLAASVRMACSVIGVAQLPQEVAGAIHERAGGNPFFVEELCQTLLEQDLIRVHQGRAEPVGSWSEMHLPATVQGVIRTRLDRLDADAREVVRVASVIGREFALPVLQRAMGDEVHLERALGRLKDLGLLHQVQVLPEAAYRFKHVLTQEVAYDTLLHHQRRELHRRVGLAIESVYGERSDQHSNVLAHHFGEAEDWRRAVRYGREAAGKAHALSEFARALEILDRVEQCARKLRDEAERHEVMIDVLLQQEHQCETLGLRDRQQAILERLLTLFEARKDQRRLAEVYRRQGDLLTLRKRYSEAEPVLQRALMLNRELRLPAGERKTLTSLGLLCWHAGRSGEALGYLEEALQIDRAEGDRYAIANDLHNIGVTLKDLGEYERALAVVNEALAIAEDNPLLSSHMLPTLGTVFRRRGDPERALECMERALECARRQPGSEVKVGFTLLSVAHLQLEQGRVEQSLDTYRQAVEVARRTRNADGLSQALRILGEVLMGLGRGAEALPHFHEALKVFGQMENRSAEAQVWTKIATVHDKLGNHAEAEAAWSSARQLLQRLSDVAGEVDALVALARSARLGRRDFTAARTELDEALRLAEPLGDKSRVASVRNALGIVAWECGDYAEALHHYQQALELCTALGDSSNTGLILNSIGATLVRVGRPQEAQRRLEEAVAFNRGVGQRLLEGHALAALGDLHRAGGHFAEAKRCYLRSLRIRRLLRDRRGEGWMLERLARVSQNSSDSAREARRWEAARRIAEEVGDQELISSCQDGVTNA